MITTIKFKSTIANFPILEKRGSFYDMATNLLNKKFEIEAYVLILATWNFAYFRYGVKNFDINNFKKKIKELEPCFDKLDNEECRTIDIDRHKETIKTIYDALAAFEGVGATGASKIMHLRNRNLFIMWDRFIRGDEAKSYYDNLDTIAEGYPAKAKYGNNGYDYCLFLKDMQETFRNVVFDNENKTFAKAIDEYNYISITLKIQAAKKEEEKKKNRK